jgi:DNA invertase Pin-like site-specific DNA recombinase
LFEYNTAAARLATEKRALTRLPLIPPEGCTRSSIMATAKTQLIPAVAYLRKSTKGIVKDTKRQRQEKSLAQQREEILKLARGQYEVVKWFEDEGVSGWKRGPKRPSYTAMLEEVKSLGAKAILVDNIDRFSRATYDDVLEDSRELAKIGVRWIVTASRQEFDIDAGRRGDIGGIITFAAGVWAAHEYSKNLSRRVSLARRNAAATGKRTGGLPPYGLVADGQGGLCPGDPKQVEVVRWVFSQFAGELRSMNWITGELNHRKVPAPRGGEKGWGVRTVKLMLANRVYIGEFSFNRRHQGQFYGIDAEGEVREKAELGGAGKVFVTGGKYPPVIDSELFGLAQKRLAAIAGQPFGRKSVHVLSGVLFCGHCGGVLHGLKRSRGGPTVYRCSTSFRRGRGQCRQYEIREDRVLPFVLNTIRREFDDLAHQEVKPPVELTTKKPGKLTLLRAAHSRLAARVALAEKNLLMADDPRTVKSLDNQITGWRDELDRLAAELSVSDQPGELDGDGVKALANWWKEFLASAVQVPTDWHYTADGGDTEYLNVPVEPHKLNHVLRSLGVEVKLWWKGEKFLTTSYKNRFYTKAGRRVPMRGGLEKTRYVLARGRLRLGQQAEELSLNRQVFSTSVDRDTEKLPVPLVLLSRVDRVFDAALLAS